MDYYDIPITERVERFLEENSHIWATVGYIAANTHLVDWQVQQQLTQLLSSNKITHWDNMYCWLLTEAR